MRQVKRREIAIPLSATGNTPIRVYVDGAGDPGEWFAWVLDLIECVAFAPTEMEALAKVPQVVAEYCEFVRRHIGKDGTCAFSVGEPVVAEELVGVDEGLFEADREEASVEQIERTIELLSWSRADLLTVLASAPEAAFGWDPPYSEVCLLGAVAHNR